MKHPNGDDCPNPVDTTTYEQLGRGECTHICGCDPRPYTSDCGCVWPSHQDWRDASAGGPNTKIWSCLSGDMTDAARVSLGRTLACPDCDYRNTGSLGLLNLHRAAEHPVDHGIRGPECEAGTCDCSDDPDAGTDRPPTPEPTESGTQCPPGVHSMFDFCPGDCTEPVEDGTNGRGAAARPARHTARTLPADCDHGYCAFGGGPGIQINRRKVKVDPDAHVCATSRCWQDCRNKTDVDKIFDLGPLRPGDRLRTDGKGGWWKDAVEAYTDPGLTGITTEKGRRGILAASIRRFGRRVLDNLRGW